MFKFYWRASSRGEQIYERDVLGGPDPPQRVDALGGADSAQITDLFGGPDKGEEDLLARPIVIDWRAARYYWEFD
jgi:hypothetical protein